MAYYALIKNNKVENIIKADEKYAELIAPDFDDVYELKEGEPKPMIKGRAIKTGSEYVFAFPSVPSNSISTPNTELLVDEISEEN